MIEKKSKAQGPKSKVEESADDQPTSDIGPETLDTPQPQQSTLDYGQGTLDSRNRPVECLGMTFESDDARRTYFLDKLRERLRDPEFRKIEGFPIGSDEDILALSDPPYYTACPNPFVRDFIAHWSAEKRGLRTEQEAQDTQSSALSPQSYHREPFAADVSEGKNAKVYRAHSYHTKVPPKAIVPFIQHFTDPDHIILDAFCGSGMTGLAGQECQRPTILCDLAPGATFIANYYNAFPKPSEIKSALNDLIKEVRLSCEWLYRVKHSETQDGILNYTILSEVFFCQNCTNEITYWEVDKTSECPHCGVTLKKGELQRKITASGKTEVRPVHIYYFVSKKRYDRPANAHDLALLKDIETKAIPFWYPVDNMLQLPPPWGDYYRAGYHQGYERVSDFYTKRNLWTIACMWQKISDLNLPDFMRFIVTSLLAMRCSMRMPYREGGRSAGAINNLHIPSLIQEYNPIEVLERKGKAFIEAAMEIPKGHRPLTTTQSSTDLHQLPENSIDYVFVDPPFGSNIIYSELNFLWEAWFRVFSKQGTEAIVSSHQKKGFLEYSNLMYTCFKEMHRTLKPGRWITVEFHNSQNAIWSAIQEALASAGFIIADVHTLDKQQGSYKQVSTAGAVKQDLVISAYKPNGGLEERFKLEAGTEEGVWDFVRTHLKQLPVFVSKDGKAEIIAERQNYLLFDRMVAFHVQRGVTVPLSAAEFYAGITQRFSERDGMYFLPEQVAEYDKKRMTVREVLQLQLFVTDESSAIQWLKQQITKKPQTFQELHPQFLKEIGGWQKYEKPLELSELLEQNFLRYDGKGPIPAQIVSWLKQSADLRKIIQDELASGSAREENGQLSTQSSVLITRSKDRWYVPDPNKAGDLEKLRERSLLKEFEDYRTSSQKRLKVFRLEAVRAGFKKAWQERDYATIIAVARKVPENVLQEDPKLLMWYDQAVTRTGDAETR